MKDDLFYFSLTFPSLENGRKKKTKSTIKDQKKTIRKPPPNPQKVMSFPYPWNFFFLFCSWKKYFFKSCLIVERESEIIKCLFSSVESPGRAPTFSGCAWAGLARIFLWTELHVQCLLPVGKRVGGGSDQSRARNVPPVASFEADVLCLYTAATVVSSLCLLLPHARPHPAVTPFILPLEPQGQVCFKLLKDSIGLDLGHTCPQLDRLPHLRGERWTLGS